MRLLCIETATPAARVAVVDDGGRAVAAGIAIAERHSANVLRLTDEVLRDAGIAAGDLGGVACGAGPGSFTGLRVGLSVAKGLALATGAPLILVPSLAALALDMLEAAGEGAAVVPCIDAGKGEVYAAVYRADAEGLVRADADGEPWRLPPADLAARLAALGADVVVAGNGAERFAGALGRPLLPTSGPTALSIGRLALLRHRRGESDDLDSAVPLYGRPPDITVSKKAGPAR
jgi:tRNA threonylcarbamoyladenosine biosynthesis protein TsaB